MVHGIVYYMVKNVCWLLCAKLLSSQEDAEEETAPAKKGAAKKGKAAARGRGRGRGGRGRGRGKKVRHFASARILQDVM